MSIWTRIQEALAALASGEPLSDVFERLRGAPEKSVGFTIAVIALGAKMAKADGLVTREEVTAFREVFTISDEDEGQAARVFNLARQDVAGFEEYARRVRRMFDDDAEPLCDLLRGLFHIAMADGEYHPAEDEFLGRVAEILGFDARRFRQIRAQFVAGAERDPYEVLGLPHDATLAQARAAWRAQVRETHPDRLVARGLPEEAIKMAQSRLIAINAAWEQISKEAA